MEENLFIPCLICFVVQKTFADQQRLGSETICIFSSLIVVCNNTINIDHCNLGHCTLSVNLISNTGSSGLSTVIDSTVPRLTTSPPLRSSFTVVVYWVVKTYPALSSQVVYPQALSVSTMASPISTSPRLR